MRRPEYSWKAEMFMPNDHSWLCAWMQRVRLLERPWDMGGVGGMGGVVGEVDQMSNRRLPGLYVSILTLH